MIPNTKIVIVSMYTETHCKQRGVLHGGCPRQTSSVLSLLDKSSVPGEPFMEGVMLRLSRLLDDAVDYSDRLGAV